MKRTHKLLALLLAMAFILVCGVPAGVAAAADGADQDYDGIPDEYDRYPTSNIFTGRMKSGHDSTTSVSYTMDFRSFFGGNTVYHPDIASVSVIGSALAYYTASPTETYVTYTDYQTWEGGSASTVDGVQLMRLHGFEDVVDYTLDSYGDDDICEMVIGHAKVGFEGETRVIIGIWVRGTEPTSQEEWSSNFNVGDLVRFFDEYDSVAGKSPRQKNDDWTRKTNHRGFDVCATRLLNYLNTYYLDEYVTPALQDGESVCYWLCGHSRGGAVANIMASYLVDAGKEVFCYTFASPYCTANTEASAEKYDCIFNLVNSNDFVPTLPMPEWGFTRYGKTAYVDASQWATEIKTATGETYDGKYLSASDINTMLDKFICITGENSDRNNPGKILGWREVYVYHCGHNHAGETNGNYQASTFRAWGLFGPYENDYYNKYPIRLQKYSYWDGGICQTPAYCMQVLVELMVGVANGSYLSSGWTYLTSNKLADKFDINKQSLVSYATKLTEPHFMDTYSVIQAQINAAGNPGARFATLQYYTAENAAGGRPVHTHTYTYVPYEGHEPTCTEEGFGYRYCTCSEHNSDWYDDVQKNVVIPALGHDWAEPEYVWAEDYPMTCTASRVCVRDAAHSETETAVAVYAVVTEPTYEADGLGRWTAVFENEAFDAQTFDVVIPMLEPVYYTVTFVDGLTGEVISTVTAEEGQPAEAPLPPVHEGYEFAGWDRAFDAVTEDMTVTALYNEVQAPTVLLGDVNCDGHVTASDISALFAYVMNAGSLSEQALLNADLDGNGTVDATDASLLAQLVFGS
ncbi:MAG: InlB B-repeat-containing protein [Clostridia bacterium]|nr:InlB B-repeat-containing protein [Clostridia bacterium]